MEIYLTAPLNLLDARRFGEASAATRVFAPRFYAVNDNGYTQRFCHASDQRIPWGSVDELGHCAEKYRDTIQVGTPAAIATLATMSNRPLVWRGIANITQMRCKGSAKRRADDLATPARQDSARAFASAEREGDGACCSTTSAAVRGLPERVWGNSERAWRLRDAKQPHRHWFGESGGAVRRNAAWLDQHQRQR
jgi:hypothetical protein